MEEYKLLCDYIVAILGYDPDLLAIGRRNEYLENNEVSMIAVDSVASTTRLSLINKFNSTDEIQTLGGRYRRPMQIVFYGNDAYDNVDKFMAMQRSQLALETKTNLGISVTAAYNEVDARLLTGSLYNNLVEVTVDLIYNRTLNIDTKRFDESEASLLINK